MKNIPKEIAHLVKVAETIQQERGKVNHCLLIRRTGITLKKANEVINWLK